MEEVTSKIIESPATKGFCLVRTSRKGSNVFSTGRSIDWSTDWSIGAASQSSMLFSMESWTTQGCLVCLNRQTKELENFWLELVSLLIACAFHSINMIIDINDNIMIIDIKNDPSCTLKNSQQDLDCSDSTRSYISGELKVL